MRVLTTSGCHLVPVVPGSGTASVIGSHWNAVQAWRDRGDKDGLAAFINTVVSGYRLEADPEAIKRWAKRGDLDIDDPYEPLGGDR